MNMNTFHSGNYISQGDYTSFSPTLINHSWRWNDAELNILLEQASSELGSLNAFSDLIPNIDIYIRMHIKTEANKSNKIEGTKTSIEEDLLPAEDIAPEKRDDQQEVRNYIKALNYGIKRILGDDFPLCNRLICEIHKLLLSGVRGKYKTPGEIRKSQNWIGGSKPSDAVYVPPSIIELPDLMSDFEKFINTDDWNVPNLIKIAILHYQFETIHPFLDGNGRIGRLIIPLYLLDKNMLSKPCFYISDFFEKHRTEYYDALNRVRLNNDLIGWIKFFLKAVIETAKSAKVKFKNVTDYVKDTEERALKLGGRPENILRVLRLFYDNPLLSSSVIAKETGISKGTVDNIIKKLYGDNILVEVTGYSRNRLFALMDYLKIFI
ncbi:Fic family protein [Mogibacterium sp. CM50]|uniref:Fic family protein n=1 Tax=Mogibacterium sp. CM50 TaxID=936375 RepID=UPI00027C4BE9|nr:Fic family protein [Mogibacterium sp. CM50]EJU23326.1 Fic/DOC family protein [Mogibacterium sp. CM50]